MTEAEELFAIFKKCWRSGTNARLNVECHAGKVWATLNVAISQPPPSPYQQDRPHLHRRASPSRLRRRARRAAARAHAAAEAAEAEVTPMTERKIDETVNSVEEADVASVQTTAEDVSFTSQPEPRAEQAVPNPNSNDYDDATRCPKKNDT